MTFVVVSHESAGCEVASPLSVHWVARAAQTAICHSTMVGPVSLTTVGGTTKVLPASSATIPLPSGREERNNPVLVIVFAARSNVRVRLARYGTVLERPSQRDWGPVVSMGL